MGAARGAAACGRKQERGLDGAGGKRNIRAGIGQEGDIARKSKERGGRKAPFFLAGRL